MSSFTDPPIISPLPDGRNWLLVKDFVYEIGSLGSGDKIVVPASFKTDLASIPRLFWSFWPPTGRYSSASILHDYLYFSHERTKEESDDIFYEAMLILNVKKWKAKIFYNAVKIFGQKAYDKR